MYCQKCGADIRPVHAVFCSECGTATGVPEKCPSFTPRANRQIG